MTYDISGHRMHSAEYYAFHRFRYKSVLIIIPHQDDEVCVTGSLIRKFSEIKCEIKVVYVTDGGHVWPSYVRKEEALAALKVLGVSNEKVYFLNYPDTLNGSKEHYYHDRGNRNALISQLESFISDKPDAIIANDLDYHSDHRAVSLAVDYATANVVKRSKDYHPFLLKAFAYEGAFYGPSDYDGYKLGSQIFNNMENLDNPTYNWNQRLRLPVPRYGRTPNILDNAIYKAMRCHKSQAGSRFVESIANSEQVYWVKRTDNLLYRSDVEIEASSGNKEFLNDGLRFDIDDILKDEGLALSYQSGLWIPDLKDESKTITITFNKPLEVGSIKVFENPDPEHRLNRISVSAIYIERQEIHEEKICSKMMANKEKACCHSYHIGSKLKSLTIRVETDDCLAGIGEIEVYNGQKHKLWFTKITCDSNYIYDWLDMEKCRKLDIISYDVCGEPIISKGEINEKISKVRNRHGKYIMAEVTLDGKTVSDFVRVRSVRAIKKFLNTMVGKAEHAYIWIDSWIQIKLLKRSLGMH